MVDSCLTHRVRLVASGREFEAREDETVLTAALRQGIVLPYSCRNGSCASCKCRLQEGSIHYPYHPPVALSSAEIHAGDLLACQAVARSDLLLHARPLQQIEEIPVRILPARVESMEDFTGQIKCLRLKLPEAVRLQFLAGQYIDILLPGGKRRSFSIASPPSATDHLELHVKQVAGGGFTGHVFEGMKVKDILRLEGPLGTFFFRRRSSRPALMVGGGTGFAPLKAMIEELLHAGDPRPLHLFWGTAGSSDLYARPLIKQWQQANDKLRFTPVISAMEADWPGETGYVHEAVLRHYPDLSAHDVYMSGPPAMIHAARRAFLAARVPEDRLFYDSFDFAPDVPPAAL